VFNWRRYSTDWHGSNCRKIGDENKALLELFEVGKSKLDQFRVKIEALIANSSSQKFVAPRYGTSEVNISRWRKKQGLNKEG